ncbi:hypothetical protein HYH03_011407 [Edaphochlamys debaryana]|uniref:Uncharacterized protein n=1 Tax=Edaphochlamys debaryana TaxID=47281 RepID=A0A835XXB7_9CHLO|nr:hypothetical protein HYH03_011407 [Edaphochlamys debaryana]|eukprot:KAG2490101.1 hypothetical protein HYH03_011407 [Edaphochlamys debaryana]
MLSSEQARRVNLAEVLLEALEEDFPGADLEPPPEAELVEWSEERIRGHFEALRLSMRLPRAGVGSLTGEKCGAGAGPNKAHGGSEAATAPGGPTAAPMGPGSGEEAQAPRPVRAPPPVAPGPDWDPALFARWFPGLRASGTATDQPRLRVIAFHSAGNAEDMFTSEGTGARRSPSPLLDWCRRCGVELLAVQMPGRAARRGERAFASMQEAAEALLPVLTPFLLGTPTSAAAFAASTSTPSVPSSRLSATAPSGAGAGCTAVPYCVLSHSYGCWEEMRGWDINEVVFSDGMWQMYEPLLRADARMYDEYELWLDVLDEQHAANRQLLLDELLSEGVEQPHCFGKATFGAAAKGAPPAAAVPVTASSVSGGGGTGGSGNDGGRTNDAGVMPFDFPITAFWGAQDRRVRQPLVAPWAGYTRAPFRLAPIAGNHLWPLNCRAAKEAWLRGAVGAFERALGWG